MKTREQIEHAAETIIAASFCEQDEDTRGNMLVLAAALQWAIDDQEMPDVVELFRSSLLRWGALLDQVAAEMRDAQPEES